MRTRSAIGLGVGLLAAAAACTSGPRSPAPAPEGAVAPAKQPQALAEALAMKARTQAPSGVTVLPGRIVRGETMPVYCPSAVPYMPVAPGDSTDPFMERGPVVPNPCSSAPGSSALALGSGRMQQYLYPGTGERIHLRGRATVPVDSTVRLAPGVEMLVLPNGDTVRAKPRPKP